MAGEIKAIAEDQSRDLVEIQTKNGTKKIPNGVAPQRDRLRIQTRQWLMERWAPKEFGSAQRMELTGADGGPLLLQQITLLAMQQIDSERVTPALPESADKPPSTESSD